MEKTRAKENAGTQMVFFFDSESVVLKCFDMRRSCSRYAVNQRNRLVFAQCMVLDAPECSFCFSGKKGDGSPDAIRI